MPGNSIGQRLVLTSFGESHGTVIGAVLDGCPAGLELDESDVQAMLDKRRPGQNIISTQRKEADVVEIISGVFRGHTTGAPITMMIRNSDQRSGDYEGDEDQAEAGAFGLSGDGKVRQAQRPPRRGKVFRKADCHARHGRGGGKKAPKGHNGGGDEFVHGADRRHEDERGVWPGHGRSNL